MSPTLDNKRTHIQQQQEKKKKKKEEEEAPGHSSKASGSRTFASHGGVGVVQVVKLKMPAGEEMEVKRKKNGEGGDEGKEKTVEKGEMQRRKRQKEERWSVPTSGLSSDLLAFGAASGGYVLLSDSIALSDDIGRLLWAAENRLFLRQKKTSP